MVPLNLFGMGPEYDPYECPLGRFCAVCGRWGWWSRKGMCKTCYTSWEGADVRCR